MGLTMDRGRKVAGSVRERSKGRWQVRAYAGRDPVTGKERYIERTVSAGSRREARKLATLLVAEIATGKHVGTSEMTFGEMLDRWFDLKRTNLSPTTIRAYETNVRNHVRPALGSVKLAKLRTIDIDNLYAEMAKRVGPSMIRRTHVIVRGALDRARKWGFVATNVASDASPPPLPRNRIEPPSLEDLGRILDAASDDFRPFLRLAATTGARRGELCALRWRDLDLDGRRMRIHCSVIEDGGRLLIKAPKSDRPRTVVLDAQTVSVLRSHRVRVTEQALSCGAALPADAFVFSPRPGNTDPYHPLSMTRRFARLCQQLGIKGTRLHDLRHLVATRLLAAGIDVQSVSSRLGHSRANVTLGIYSHPTGQNEERAADTIGDVVGEALRSD